MLFKIFKFEIRYWLKQPMVYIFFLINALLVFGGTISENIIIGGSTGNVHKNAPYVLENFYAILSILALVMVTAFLNSAAARDFNEKTNQILFTKPILKRDFLLGRFFGAAFIAMIPFLGISFGNLIGSIWPWLDDVRTGPTVWSAHLNSILVFTIPTILFAGSFIFCIAALTRNTVTSFIGSILLIVGFGIAQSLIRNLDNEVMGALLDPFGIRTFSIATKYWTVEDKNTMSVGLSGLMLINRLIWITVGILIMIFTYYRFSFSDKVSSKSKKGFQKDESVEDKWIEQAIPVIKPEFSSALSRKQLFSQIKIEIIGLLKNTSFIIIMFAGMLNLVASMFFVTDAGYGNKSFPVTYTIIDSIQGSLYTFIIAIITFYTGVIVWKERDSKVNDIYDALPFKGWIPLYSKTVAMWFAIEVILFIAVLVGISTQLFNGFHNIKLTEYIVQVLIFNSFTFLYYIVLSILIHILVNNKYLAYFVFIAYLIADSFIWPALNVGTNMVSYGSTPSLTYSDMNGFGPFLTGLLWFKSYWLLFAIVLLIVSSMWWIRGRDTTFKIRLQHAKFRYKTSFRTRLILALVAWIICGSFVFYNTKVINKFRTGKQAELLQADYEKKYKKYEGINQPRITDVKYEINLFPKQRKLDVHAHLWIKNKSVTNIDSIHFTMIDNFKIDIDIPSSKLVFDDKDHGYRIYCLATPMHPGDSIRININSTYEAKGFENEVSVTQIVDNGTFFNNADILPEIGYQPNNELSDREKRREHDLKDKEGMPKLERNCNAHCMDTYLSNNSDWVNVETVFSTDKDQIAIAPGSLLKQWTENDRTYFNYKLDHYAMNFYSFISARYQVQREKFNGVDIEVYYSAEHEWNVNKMLKSLRNSLAYYEANYGPYYNKQTRIIEFPRYASFAQAFPGTMPYSEGIGFIANLEDTASIDMVYYVTAHETGHQWWAHQVTGANMQGATLLSETMAQYSALMVMEKLYGKDQMHKFLKYEMDNYLRSRGQERKREAPLITVESQQGYTHYRKGSVVMYYLKEMIGEEAVNRALKNMVDSFAYRQPPYPNSYDLVDRFDKETPDSLKYLIKDLFYDITLFSNKTNDASYRKLKDGKYEVTFTVEAEKIKADSLGREKTVPMNDWVEIGVYGKADDSKKYGKKLYSQMIKISSGKKTFKVIVNELPYQAGIDPDYYLIDRVPDDNMKKLTEL